MPPIPGTMAAIEAKDAFGGAGIVALFYSGLLSTFDSKDTFAGTGGLAVSGTFDATEARDISGIVGVQSFTGSLSVTDVTDVFSTPIVAEGIYALLKEDGKTLLKEDFGRIQLDVSTGKLLKQDGFSILKEDGFLVLLEGRLTPVVKTELGNVLLQQNGAAISNETAPWPSTAILDPSGNGFTDPDNSYVTEP